MVTYGAVAAAKVRVPGRDRFALHRPRLERDLDPLLQGDARAALLTAGTGFGKTTLAAQWASRGSVSGQTIAWLTIDPDDDQPPRFWSLMLAALEEATPALGAGQLRHYPVPESAGENAFIDGVITTIAAAGEPIVFVIDDCHRLQDRGVLQDLDYFLLRSPPNLRFMLLGRSLPNLAALYQLNLEDSSIKVTCASLAFTRRELVRFINGSPLDVDRVLELTEGWPAAVRLAKRQPAALSRQDPPNTLSDPLFAQLMQPLFDSYPPDLQELLLTVSILEDFSAEDVPHAVGRPDGTRVIARLRAETGLLLEVSGQPGGPDRYRFHRLLQRFLTVQAAAHPQGVLAAAHSRLAAWLPGQERHAEALAHAANTNDPRVVQQTLAASGLALLWSGDTAQILELADQPHSRQLDELGLLLSAIAVLDGDPSVAANCLDLLRRHGTPNQLPGTFATLATGLQGQVLLSQGRFFEAVELLEAFGAHPPHDDLDLFLTNILGAALVGVGRFDEALSLSGQGTRVAHGLGNMRALVDARSVAAAVHAARENFGMARMEAAWAIRHGDEAALRYRPSLRPAHLIAAWCAYHALDDGSARLHNAYVRRADSAAPVIAQSTSKLALILEFLSGEHRHDAAAALLDRVRFDLVHTALPQDVAICSLQTASMLLQLRHGDALETLKSELRQQQGVSGELHTISAWELLAAGHLTAARKLLTAVTSGYVESQSRCTVLTAWALTCRIALDEERAYQTRAALSEALRLGADYGMLRAFAFAGPEVRAAVVREQGYFPAYGQAIARIARFQASTPSAFCPPLTHRELDLLTLLPTFATVDEIAERLLISTNTVKTHVRGIYRKLGATSRREAIAIAQDLGLLPPPAPAPISSTASLDGSLHLLNHRYGN
ncbi:MULTISPECIES: LuxR C-terminal-related transcriptional regulator [unclassified Arthrobacter]|uniref:LuxR C-terminal-related transcriptional regulator n=1 Tax=unclassified Arthrobacter TaxID=235627 RepID=UPI00149281F2|nr:MULTISPECIES: LuxR C-terminal-related transcriptional regulator [unclassified Arthrobacter]MBE0010399.1 hypothetical protein [Arthrobacter sp. AET 35A]NOJ64278.1 hypothetical protein [Arthrobacter sp. 147(2020)]